MTWRSSPSITPARSRELGTGRVLLRWAGARVRGITASAAVRRASCDARVLRRLRRSMTWTNLPEAAPAIGTVGDGGSRWTAEFDGWGYVHPRREHTRSPSSTPSRSPRRTIPSSRSGFRATSPCTRLRRTRPIRRWLTLSYYAGGLRGDPDPVRRGSVAPRRVTRGHEHVRARRGRRLSRSPGQRLLGRRGDPGPGQPQGEVLILASDRDYGYYISATREATRPHVTGGPEGPARAGPSWSPPRTAAERPPDRSAPYGATALEGSVPPHRCRRRGYAVVECRARERPRRSCVSQRRWITGADDGRGWAPQSPLQTQEGGRGRPLPPCAMRR